MWKDTQDIWRQPPVLPGKRVSHYRVSKLPTFVTKPLPHCLYCIVSFSRLPLSYSSYLSLLSPHLMLSFLFSLPSLWSTLYFSLLLQSIPLFSSFSFFHPSSLLHHWFLRSPSLLSNLRLPYLSSPPPLSSITNLPLFPLLISALRLCYTKILFSALWLFSKITSCSVLCDSALKNSPGSVLCFSALITPVQLSVLCFKNLLFSALWLL